MRPVTRQALVAAVSDLHLSHTPPRLRAAEPDWYGAMARSLGALAKFVAGLNGPGTPPVVAYPGDIFDKWNPPPELINFAIRHLPKGYAVPGNHDLPHHNYGGVSRSAYWTLVECGVVKNLEPGRPTGAGMVDLWGFPWGVEVVPPEPHAHSLCPDVAIIHAYVWKRGCGHAQSDPADKVAGWKKRLTGYAAAFFGDNHLGFLAGNVCNCGAFMRRRADEMDTVPCVNVLYEDGEVVRHPLEVEGDVYDLQARRKAAPPGGGEPPDDYSAFFNQLTDLGGRVGDYRTALTERCKDAGLPAGVRRRLLSALERG